MEEGNTVLLDILCTYTIHSIRSSTVRYDIQTHDTIEVYLILAKMVYESRGSLTY